MIAINCMNKKTNIINMTKEWKLFICAGCVICAVWVASFVLIYLFIDDWDVRGQFGDLFGSVNALFSGLAFAGLVITIIQQRHDLQLQRQAINQSKKRYQLAKRDDEDRTFRENLLQYA